MKRQELIEEIIYIVFIFIFSLLIYAKNVLNIEVHFVILLILIFSYMIITKKPIAEIIAFLIPFRSAIHFSYIIMFSIILFIIRKKGKLNIDSSFFLLLIVFIIEIINSINIYSNIKLLFTFISIYLFIYLWINSEKQPSYCVDVIKSALLGICIAAFIYLMKTVNYITIAKFLELKYRLGSTTNISGLSSFSNFSLNFNANELATFSLLGISLLFYLKGKNMQNNICFYLILSFLIIIGVLTTSRSFLIGLILYFITFVISNKKKFLKVIVYSLILLMAVLLLNSYNDRFLDGVIENYEARFEAKDITGGRANLFAIYNKVIFSSTKNILIGSGTQNYSLKNNCPNVAHNSTQEVFVAWGVVGGIVYIVFLYSLFKHSKFKNIKYSLDSYLPLICLLFMIQTIPFVSQGSLNLLTFVVLAPFGIIETQQENQLFITKLPTKGYK